jgi:hypothetical protein
MQKGSKGIALSVVLALVVIALTLSNSAISAAFHSTSRAFAAAPHQDATPTPEPAPRSEAGSTDRIMWMGFAIVLIVLLPVVTRRSLWH